MTSAEVWHTGLDPVPEPDPNAEPEQDGENPPSPGTPWTKPGQRKPGGPGTPAPAAPGSGGAQADPSKQAAPGEGTPAAPPAAAPPAAAAPAAPAPPAPAPATSGSIPSGVGASTVGTGGPVQAATPGTGAGAVPPQPAAGRGADGHDGGGLDPDTMMSILPAAMMGMSMLPMLASALSGLGKGGGGNGSGTQQSGSGGTLTPEAQQALDALQKLKKTYGDEGKDPTGPNSGGSGKQLDTGTGSGSSAGSGKTAAQIKAHQLFQRNAATAFNTLDNDLVNYMRRLAGKHKLDKKAVTQLLRDVDTELAELGSAAYTKAGQLKVHDILTKALEKATRIVSGGSANSKEAAAEINRLTKQYMYNLAGRKYTQPAGTTASSAAQKAVQVALQQQGDPYVWGAEGPNSFDCSGLTQYAARAAGVQIPRVASAQYRQLPEVAPNAIQPGDLIFPQSEFNNGNPGHVMMYIGNGKCVEAPHTGAVVRVVNLPSSYHATRWAK
ncbi:C40 family peptidase [Nocardia mikamii]|uniref:C40 family peptidase n=1 Tax=Nocardia mikamii TaxID=508464 RepID=UPI000A53E177|nr:DUF4226 domain-containing protein [Nocardia mikamii]